MKQVFFTFVATSLFWFGFYKFYTYFESNAQVEQQSAEQSAEDFVADFVEQSELKEQSQPGNKDKSIFDLLSQEVAEKVQETKPLKDPVAESVEENLFGYWEPIEGAEWPLEFTRYGTAIQYPHGLAIRYDYSTQGEAMKIDCDRARFALVEEEGELYLDLYNTTDFSGRYKRLSQPRKISVNGLDQESYPTLIVGRWSPVDGQEWDIEFSRFGAVIQYPHGLEMRYDYELNGTRAKIHDDKAVIVISEDAHYYYLEIYNTCDFSGRYRRTKR